MQNSNILTVHDLSLAAARQLLDNGLNIARDRDMHLSIAIVDRAGKLLAFARMDETLPLSIDVAIGKARTAAHVRGPSKVFEDMVNSGSPSVASVPGLVPLQGGMPILYKGEVVGAVGVSGSTGANDQTVASEIAASLGD